MLIKKLFQHSVYQYKVQIVVEYNSHNVIPNSEYVISFAGAIVLWRCHLAKHIYMFG